MIKTLKSRFNWIYSKEIELLSRKFQRKNCFMLGWSYFWSDYEKNKSLLTSWQTLSLPVQSWRIYWQKSVRSKVGGNFCETENLTWESVNWHPLFKIPNSSPAFLFNLHFPIFCFSLNLNLQTEFWKQNLKRTLL